MSAKDIKSFGPGEAIMGYVKNSWWVLMILAILSVILGLYAVFFPGATMEFFIIFFGALLITGGVIGAIRSFVGDKMFSGFSLALGVIAFVAGLLIVLHPVAFAGILVYLIAIILLIKSLLSLRLATNTKNGTEAWLIISGVLGIIASILLFVSPVVGGLAVLLLLGIYLIVFGIISIIDLISARKKFSKLIKK